MLESARVRRVVPVLLAWACLWTGALAAQDPDNCAGACGAWARATTNDFCGATPRWLRQCTRGSAPRNFTITQQTCAAANPGVCSVHQSLLPAAGCKGYCDPWYWQSNSGSCSNWRRLCHDGGVNGLWEDTCSGVPPGACAGCLCENGADFNRTSIDAAATYCAYNVCGADFQRYDCRVGGWKALGGSCPSANEPTADVCPSRTGTVARFPTSALAVRAINYFPREHYQGRMWSHWDVRSLRQDLDLLRTMNVNAVRVILNEDALGENLPSASAAKLDRLLCELNRRGMKAVFLLGLRNDGFPCSGPMSARNATFISTVVSRYRNDPTVLLWEVTNEPLCGGDKWDVLEQPVQDRIANALAYLKAYDPNHSASFALLQDQIDDVGSALMNAIDVFDFHVYDPNPRSFSGVATTTFPDNYIQKAKQAAGTKPIFLGEFGCMAAQWGTGTGGAQHRYCRGGTGTLAQLEADQATFFNAFYDKAFAQGYAGTAPWMVYEAAAQDPADASQNIEFAAWPSFGFVRADRSLKPAGSALRTKYLR